MLAGTDQQYTKSHAGGNSLFRKSLPANRMEPVPDTLLQIRRNTGTVAAAVTDSSC